MSIPVRAGEPVRLFFQMEDGIESFPVVVKATLRDEAGILLEEKTLTHVGLGLFKDSSFVLTTQKEVVVQYRVYEEDGVTPHSDFVIDANRFISSDGSSGGSSVIAGNEFVIEVDGFTVGVDP